MSAAQFVASQATRSFLSFLVGMLPVAVGEPPAGEDASHSPAGGPAVAQAGEWPCPSGSARVPDAHVQPWPHAAPRPGSPSSQPCAPHPSLAPPAPRPVYLGLVPTLLSCTHHCS